MTSVCTIADGGNDKCEVGRAVTGEIEWHEELGARLPKLRVPLWNDELVVAPHAPKRQVDGRIERLPSAKRLLEYSTP